MDLQSLLPEVTYKAIRSSGSGGQHVNKTSSKVALHFNIDTSQVLQDDQKEWLKKNLQSRLTKDNELILQCDESRSQHKNKTLVTERFLKLIEKGLLKPKKRKKTKVPKSVKIKRLKSKRKHSEKKANRQKPNLD